MRKPLFVLAGIALVLALAAPQASPAASSGGKGSGKHPVLDSAGVQRLKDSIGRNARVSISDATGAVRFVGKEPGAGGDLMSRNTQPARQKSYAFLSEYAGVFGLKNPGAELRLAQEQIDRSGGTHLTYVQVYRDVPVFAGVIKVHFNDAGELTSVDGNIIPEIGVDPNASRSPSEAAKVALARVGEESGKRLAVQSTQLLVYRTGLARGVDGDNHLAWQVEVGNGGDVREFVYVDAHSGKVVDQVTGIFDAMFRRAYDGMFLPTVPPGYPGSPFWVEGQPFPTGNTEADNMIISSKETYDFYSHAFGRDSFDAAGAIMDSIFNRGYSCPNASWNGTFISFCNGLTTDDVTGHEWTHAYTQYTHGLIYAWQPGALNESYSDIFGETIDKINGRGGDTPDNPRTDNCSTFGGVPPPALTITGGSAAGSYFSRASVNEPPRPFTIGPTAMAIVVTAPPFQPTGACGAVSGVSGKIAIVDWTLLADGVTNECGSGVRANNARLAGATGIIFVAPAAGLLNLGASTLIGSVEVTNADGATIKAGLPASATISLGVGTDNSVRWLIGEDDTAVGLSGPLRDMWSPRCFGNPGKISDTFEYTCSTADGGGVHTNSGVPNHAYALIVDGGTYNGQTITGIGLTKAAHIYFRAMAFHQNPATDFPAHADAIEQSATELIGVNLADLNTGAPSGQIITAADVLEVQQAMLAVQMRTPPTQCNFQPLLGQNPPPDPACGADAVRYTLFSDNFEGDTSGWSVSHEAIGTGGFTDRDWFVSSTLPDGRAGKAFYGPDPNSGTCDVGGDESGVLHLTSPAIPLPATLSSGPILTFEHWVATETGWDGGQLMLSVNGGPYTLVPQANFIYNAHNLVLNTAAGGNSNPRAGQRAWSGTDGGSVDGSWGRTIVNLAGLAGAGQTIRLRWDMSTDGCGGVFGWYVDDVTVYVCIPDLPTATAYLRGTGPDANPPTLFLGSVPTATNPKYRDSAGINFNKGNPYMEIGTWTVTPPLGGLASVGPLNTWIGLKNSDDIGTRFDLRVELYKNGELLTRGLTRCIQDVTRDAKQAKAVAVAFDAMPGTAFSGSDVLKLKVLTRIGTNPNDTLCGGHSNAVGLRLYFDSTNRASKFVENP